MRRNPVTGVGEVLLGRVAAEAESDRRTRLTIIETQRAQHVARPPRAARAGRPERKGDVAQVGDQACSVEPFAADVEVAVETMRGAAVDRPARSKRMNRRLPQLLDMVVIARLALVGELCRS